MTDVYLEIGKKRVFACAYDWPGWCRAGRDDAAALEALREYLPRYAAVTSEAGLEPPDDHLSVLERLPGDATTDFGAPSAIPSRDSARMTPQASERMATLVRAAWTVFDRVVANAPVQLRKGPRGGGRDRNKVVDHVYGAESAYAVRLGVRLRQPPLNDPDAVLEFRTALLEALQHPLEQAKWPAPTQPAASPGTPWTTPGKSKTAPSRRLSGEFRSIEPYQRRIVILSGARAASTVVRIRNSSATHLRRLIDLSTSLRGCEQMPFPLLRERMSS